MPQLNARSLVYFSIFLVCFLDFHIFFPYSQINEKVRILMQVGRDLEFSLTEIVRVLINQTIYMN